MKKDADGYESVSLLMDENFDPKSPGEQLVAHHQRNPTKILAMNQPNTKSQLGGAIVLMKRLQQTVR